jgi:hypothetical protein
MRPILFSLWYSSLSSSFMRLLVENISQQGVGWLIRKAIGMMNVQVQAKSYQDSQGIWHIDIEQPGAAGIKGTSELRTIDGKPSPHEDHVFGKVERSSEWAPVSAVKGSQDDAFLKEGWLDEEILLNHVKSVGNGWIATHVWGFANVEDGGVAERRYVRKVVVEKGGKAVKARLVYDYAPAP